VEVQHLDSHHLGDLIGISLSTSSQLSVDDLGVPTVFPSESIAHPQALNLLHMDELSASALINPAGGLSALIDIELVHIPEPSTFALLVLGLSARQLSASRRNRLTTY